MSNDTTRDESGDIAATLAKVLPKAEKLDSVETSQIVAGLVIQHYAVPKNADLKKVEVDLEAYLPNPRKTKARPAFADPESFLAYVARHATDSTVAWCDFNPQTFGLSLQAVIDEHAKGTAGWRDHRAIFVPDMSAEWKAWKGSNTKSMPQLAFAEWIQEHEADIACPPDSGMPTSLQMLKMATDFEANEERALKSTVRLESGGVRLTYIADPDAGTTAEMKLFEKFSLGIPVFHGGESWAMSARLKYRMSGGKVSFHYELVRPDRVHEHAAKELIGAIRAGLGSVSLLMGRLD